MFVVHFEEELLLEIFLLELLLFISVLGTFEIFS